MDGRTSSEEDKKLGEQLVVAQKSLTAALALAKSLFKADHPYRTKLSLVGTLGTATGTVNFQMAVNVINSVQEWSSISTLFDEFYVHSVTIHYQPVNRHLTVPTGGTLPAQIVTSSTSGAMPTMSAGLIIVPLFSIPAYYSTSAGMLNSPARKLVMSDSPWVYTWRNNVRFDPHGYSLDVTSDLGWQGWMYLSSATHYGGATQVRAVNDVVMAGGTSSVLGTHITTWDVSFRVRA